MTTVNLFAHTLDREITEAGFRARFARLGDVLGGNLLGASLYELPPGERGMPYHAHHGNEELMVMLSGTADVRTPDKDIVLQPGDTMLFQVGHRGTHQVINRSEEPIRYLVVSTLNLPEVAEFPDTGKIFIRGSVEGELLTIIDGGSEREWLAEEPTGT
jgi:uncharacterized cupin superfamily protein